MEQKRNSIKDTVDLFETINKTKELPKLPPKKEINILLIGKTGNCKSTIGNFLINDYYLKDYLRLNNKLKYKEINEGDMPYFIVGSNTSSCTKVLTKKSFELNNIIVNLIDTPGIYDTDNQDDILIVELYKSLKEYKKIDYLIICNQLDKFDDIQEKTLNFYIQIFPSLFKNNNFCFLTTKANDTQLQSYYYEIFGSDWLEDLENELLTSPQNNRVNIEEINKSKMNIFVKKMDEENRTAFNKFYELLKKNNCNPIKNFVLSYLVNGQFSINNPNDLSEYLSIQFKKEFLLIVKSLRKIDSLDVDKMNIIYPPKITEEIERLLKDIDIKLNGFIDGKGDKDILLKKILQDIKNYMIKIEEKKISIADNREMISTMKKYEVYEKIMYSSEQYKLRFSDIPIRKEYTFSVLIEKPTFVGCDLGLLQQYPIKDRQDYHEIIKPKSFNLTKKSDVKEFGKVYWGFICYVKINGEEKYAEKINMLLNNIHVATNDISEYRNLQMNLNEENKIYEEQINQINYKISELNNYKQMLSRKTIDNLLNIKKTIQIIKKDYDLK